MDITDRKNNLRASLVVHWLRIPLAKWGKLVQLLVQENTTCMGQRSPCATTEARVSRAYALQQKKSPQWEAWALQLDSGPYSLQWESPRAATETTCIQNKYILNKRTAWVLVTLEQVMLISHGHLMLTSHLLLTLRKAIAATELFSRCCTDNFYYFIGVNPKDEIDYLSQLLRVVISMQPKRLHNRIGK